MLNLIVKGKEYYDEENNKFISTSDTNLQLEHSLVSLYKWESKWNKSYLHTKEKTEEELLDYIKCMTITQNVPDEVFTRLSVDNIKQINEYIEAPMTATTFKEDKNAKRNHEIITAEIIYSWMIEEQIPLECQKWHLNKLMTLIRVRAIRSNPKKNKMSRKDIYAQNKALNAARKAKYHTHG